MYDRTHVHAACDIHVHAFRGHGAWHDLTMLVHAHMEQFVLE